MVIKVDQLTLMMRVIHVGFLVKGLHKSYIHYFICAGKKRVSYCLFAGQKVFADTEEILSVLSEAFNEAFL